MRASALPSRVFSAEEFDKIVEEGGDVSSISGSDESSEDEEEEEAEGIPEEEEEEAHAAGAGAGRRRRRRGGGGGAGGAAGHELQAKAVFRSGDGSLFALWRAPSSMPSLSPALPSRLTSPTQHKSHKW